METTRQSLVAISSYRTLVDHSEEAAQRICTEGGKKSLIEKTGDQVFVVSWSDTTTTTTKVFFLVGRRREDVGVVVECPTAGRGLSVGRAVLVDEIVKGARQRMGKAAPVRSGRKERAAEESREEEEERRKGNRRKTGGACGWTQA